MTDNNDSGKGYSYTGSGTNSEGNHWCARSENSTGNSGYHYSNNDGSYYYKNFDGSTYHKDSSGSSQYTTRSGQVHKK